MSNENKKTALPKLRFPEFQDAEEWEEKTLGNVSRIVAGQSPAGTFYNDKGNGVPFYQGKTDFGDIYLENPTKWTTQVTKLAGQGDILMSVRAPVGALNVATREICIGRGLAAIQPFNSKWFLYYFLNSIQKSIIGNGGSIFDSINKEQIEAIKVQIPIPSEQQKVADTLSSLDDLLTTQNVKLEALKAHKRGLMQGLFPAEGETVPKLRFPEFQNAGAWKKEKLGNLVEQKGRIGYRGYTVADIVEEGKGAISLSPGNITNEGYLTFAKSTFISWGKYDESPEIMLSDGFTVLVKTGYSFGKAALIKDLPEKSTINPQLVVLKPIHINSVFLHLLVCSADVQKQINDRISGGDIPSISQETISKFDVLIPSEEEQQKIADCLSSLDNRITAQSQKIEALKLHKKGLMQHLFPAAAEPTA